jgi:flagellar motor switch protein FliG
MTTTKKNPSVLIPVDGPKIVAEIIKHYSAANQERIMASISLKDKSVLPKIKEKLFDISSLLKASRQQLEIVVRESSDVDLILALRQVPEDVRDHLLSALSERRRQVTLLELEEMSKVRLSDVLAAQKRLLTKLEEIKLEESTINGNSNKVRGRWA